ncbi:hydantoinase/oxoprolinase family protein [Phytoactinopolyspora alkaliphila]|uniref:Hydantoinase/oxoprolinase family protein n=1 Tax=Phytoactinopolyspora alkaliphila TaxID=1783498 RepID=A0A6N9YQZ6_9ACTN|nr:hydantoinase/oxoprolinase family protein [Phytoactinopolyspora alkaliphila]NED97443.1 hydantoinase/oxoprolinase family protein [Phytoactinopolyspora alkaliphila]
MGYRIAVDTGGTFTDVVVADPHGHLFFSKGLTTPDRMFDGALEALKVAAEEIGVEVPRIIQDADVFVYGTTRATNAIIEKTTATTALFCTEGFPDVLTLREGGKLQPFNFRLPYPQPYVPRHLTFEIRERVDSQGNTLIALQEDSVAHAIAAARAAGAEAIAVSLLWSIANPEHEQRVRHLIEESWPGVPVTLSHQINPTIREYRRTSSTAIDASLKPLMQAHLTAIEADLAAAGFQGDLVVVTSAGGALTVSEVVSRPLHTVSSGPSMAPVAARAYADHDARTQNILVCDAGGTSFDVSLVQDGQIKRTRETWLGPKYQGHITGLSSVEVTSIGSGGGSIAWIDDGGLLNVGPASAGSVPGPACYGRGGTEPTVTDAAVVVGYFNPDHFLDGRLALDADAAREAIRSRVAEPLGIDETAAAEAILALANEAMIGAIREITVNQGVDPRECTLVAGGGAGGLNAVYLGRELGCPRVLIPASAGALSACGAQFSDIINDVTVSRFATTASFDHDSVNAVLEEIDERMDEFVRNLNTRADVAIDREYSVEARYPHQVWELDVPLDRGRVETEAEVAEIAARFHDVHERTFAVKEVGQAVECQYWRGRLTARLAKPRIHDREGAGPSPVTHRPAVFDGAVVPETPCYQGRTLPAGLSVPGPAIIEEPLTTIVIPPGTRARVMPSGSYLVDTDWSDDA